MNGGRRSLIFFRNFFHSVLRIEFFSRREFSGAEKDEGESAGFQGFFFILFSVRGLINKFLKINEVVRDPLLFCVRQLRVLKRSRFGSVYLENMSISEPFLI